MSIASLPFAGLSLDLLPADAIIHHLVPGLVVLALAIHPADIDPLSGMRLADSKKVVAG